MFYATLVTEPIEESKLLQIATVFCILYLLYTSLPGGGGGGEGAGTYCLHSIIMIYYSAWLTSSMGGLEKGGLLSKHAAIVRLSVDMIL